MTVLRLTEANRIFVEPFPGLRIGRRGGRGRTSSRPFGDQISDNRTT